MTVSLSPTGSPPRALAPLALAAALLVGACSSAETTADATSSPSAPSAPTSSEPPLRTLTSGGEPAALVRRYAAAASKGDYATICELITPTYKKVVEDLSGSDCPAAMKAEQQGPAGFDFAAKDLQIGETVMSADGTIARVKTTYQGQPEEVPLVKSDGQWYIDFGGEHSVE